LWQSDAFLPEYDWIAVLSPLHLPQGFLANFEFRPFGLLLSAALEATQADIAAAGVAKEVGERREISLARTTLRLSEAELVTLRAHLLELLRQAQEKPNNDPAKRDQYNGLRR